jgi:KDO2-lipid IV(A) lauroyltransferase
LKAIGLQIAMGLLRIFSVLPHFIIVIVAKFATWIVWRANGRLRRVTKRNLEICFPDFSEQQRTQLSQRSLANLSLSIVDAGRTFLRQPERLLQDITSVVGEEHLLAAAAEGNGTLVLFPHLGNWELGNLWLCERYTVTAMYGQPKAPTFDEFIRKARQRNGAKLVSTGISGLRALLNTLKAGDLVSLLPDQVPESRFGRFAPFFGEPTLTMTLATNLLSRTGAKAVSTYCKRLPGGKYELVFCPVDEAIYDSDCPSALAGLNRSVERCILECPEQYLWAYKRFKVLPNMEHRDY